MKILFLLLVLFLVSAFTFEDLTFNIENLSGQSLGPVYINYGGGSTSLLVNGSGHYDTSVPTTISYVTINGQTVYAGTPGVVTLPNSTDVAVTWGESNLTIWVDIDE